MFINWQTTPVNQSVSDWVRRSAGESVLQVVGGVCVLQHHFGDIVEILLVGQSIAAVHVIAVRQQPLHVGSDAAGSTIESETNNTGETRSNLQVV